MYVLPYANCLDDRFDEVIDLQQEVDLPDLNTEGDDWLIYAMEQDPVDLDFMDSPVYA